MAQLRLKQVDADAPEAKSLCPPLRRLGARLLQNPAADFGRDRVVGQRVHEESRTQQAAFPVLPPQQCFSTGYGAIADADLRLIVELELAVGECAPQFRVEAAARLRLGAQRRSEEAVHPATLL